jgi:hypothetical protein
MVTLWCSARNLDVSLSPAAADSVFRVRKARKLKPVMKASNPARCPDEAEFWKEARSAVDAGKKMK